MTQDERRIVEHLMTTNATEMEDLPDWLLGLVERGDGEEPSPELITAASLLLVRRERPGIGFGAARRVLADYADDPTMHEELAGNIQAFRLSCSFERLRRAGFYEDVIVGDPFDLNGEVSVRLTESDWRFFNSNPTRQEVHIHFLEPLGPEVDEDAGGGPLLKRRWAEELEQMPVALRAFHWQPVRSTKKMASMALRSSTLGLWPPRGWSGRDGKSGPIRSQSGSGIRH